MDSRLKQLLPKKRKREKTINQSAITWIAPIITILILTQQPQITTRTTRTTVTLIIVKKN